LTSIEFLGDSKVFEVFVVDGMVSTFEVMSPHFQSSDDGEHLTLLSGEYERAQSQVDFKLQNFCSEAALYILQKYCMH
jgi:hypothetical protein